MNDFANVAFGYNALSSEDKARIADLIFRLMPKDDEPITAHEIEAMKEMEDDIKNGEMLTL